MRYSREILENFIFIILLFLLYFILDFHNILLLRPQSIHFIRQTDSLAFVQTYYNDGFKFFEPTVLSQRSTDGRAIGEFPILYYITALLYNVFGQHELILKLLNISIQTIGLLYLFKLLRKVLSDVIYAFTFTFLFLSSAILLYYTNNFLPDVAALGLTLAGWYFYYQYFISRSKVKHFIISIVLFTFSSLLKVTYGLNLAAAFLSLLIEVAYLNRRTNIKQYTPVLIMFISSILVIAGWYGYVIAYNSSSNANAFLTVIRPIWNMDRSQIMSVLGLLNEYNWFTNVYYQSTLHFFFLIIIVGLFYYKKANKTILLFAATTSLGCLFYVTFFFYQFHDHDYYVIAIFPALILLVAGSFSALINKFPRFTGNIIAKVAVIILMILSMNYAKDKLSGRYDRGYDYFANIGKQLNMFDNYLDSIGVKKESKILVIGDPTPNGSLYFMNRKGWTYRDTNDATLDKLTPGIIANANYLLMTDSLFINKKSVSQLCGNHVGSYNGAQLYILKQR